MRHKESEETAQEHVVHIHTGLPMYKVFALQVGESCAELVAVHDEHIQSQAMLVVLQEGTHLENTRNESQNIAMNRYESVDSPLQVEPVP